MIEGWWGGDGSTRAFMVSPKFSTSGDGDGFDRLCRILMQTEGHTCV